MADQKEIEIKILTDGTIDIDLIGYKGVGCAEDLKNIVKGLGSIVSQHKKQDFYQDDPKACVTE